MSIYLVLFQDDSWQKTACISEDDRQRLTNVKDIIHKQFPINEGRWVNAASIRLEFRHPLTAQNLHWIRQQAKSLWLTYAGSTGNHVSQIDLSCINPIQTYPYGFIKSTAQGVMIPDELLRPWEKPRQRNTPAPAQSIQTKIPLHESLNLSAVSDAYGVDITQVAEGRVHLIRTSKRSLAYANRRYLQHLDMLYQLSLDERQTFFIRSLPTTY